MDGLFFFPEAIPHNPAVDRWTQDFPDELAVIARRWIDAIRDTADDITELLHDGHPTACAGGAAFAYVDAFSHHVNVGFYRGAELDDPACVLQGTGRFMRHVKLQPGKPVDENALAALLRTAYADMKRRTST